MSTYLVDRDLAGISMDDLGKAQQAAITTAAEHRAKGEDVRYIRSMFEPSTGHCQCMFEGSDSDVVRRVNDDAHLPYRAVTEVLDLTP
jgi:Protein of unknown function (DUF4242)